MHYNYKKYTRLIDYIYNFERFCEKFTDPMSINKRKIIITQVAPGNLIETLFFLLYHFKKERSNRSTILWILKKAEHLSNFENNFKKPRSMNANLY